MSQSSTVSFVCFLANLNWAFLCFSLNKGIFFALKSFHPILVICLHTIMIETSIYFCWRLLPVFLVPFVLCFLDWFLSSIGQHRWSSASWFAFEALIFQPLFHPTGHLVKNLAISVTEWPDDRSMAPSALAWTMNNVWLHFHDRENTKFRKTIRK